MSEELSSKEPYDPFTCEAFVTGGKKETHLGAASDSGAKESSSEPVQGCQ